VLYEFSESMMKSGAWRIPENWGFVNPNLDRSINIEGLQEFWSEAEGKGDAEMRRAASQHFNIEIGMGLGTDRWAGADYWEKRADKTITLEYILANCEVVVVGIDGGGADDLFGLVVMGRERGTKRWLVWSKGWCFRKVLERRKSIASALLGFEKAARARHHRRQYRRARASFPTSLDRRSREADRRRGLLSCVAMDPEGSARWSMRSPRSASRRKPKKLFGIDQRGHKLMNALRSIERKLIDGTFWHSDSGLLNWCVDNLKIEATATAFRATKAFAGDRKIDLAMAMFDAARSDEPQLSRIRAFARNAVSLSLLLEEQTGRVHENAARPSGLATVPPGISQPAFERFKAQFNDNNAGRANAGRVVFGDKDTTYTPFQMSQEDLNTLVQEPPGRRRLALLRRAAASAQRDRQVDKLGHRALRTDARLPDLHARSGPWAHRSGTELQTVLRLGLLRRVRSRCVDGDGPAQGRASRASGNLHRHAADQRAPPPQEPTAGREYGDKPLINSTNVRLDSLYLPGAQPRQDPIQSDPIAPAPDVGAVPDGEPK
jgi:hypothetical protein